MTSMTPRKWEWDFGNGSRLVAEEGTHDQQHCVLIRWIHNGQLNHQPLVIQVEHGPNSLRSLAEFVEYLRLWPPSDPISD